MKTRLMKLLVMLVVLITVSFAASAQRIYVKVRPTHKIIERPVQPSQEHVWIDEDWKAHGRNYRYNGGHWAKPPHHGYVWTPGHWESTRRGDVWIQGSWRKG